MVPITAGDMAYLQKSFLAMNEMIRAVAEDTTAIDTCTPIRGADGAKVSRQPHRDSCAAGS